MRIAALALLIGVSACAPMEAPSTERSPTPDPSHGQIIGMANPASVHCAETLKGELTIVETADGQVGVCRLKDGRVCEEWDLFREGRCTPPPSARP